MPYKDLRAQLHPRYWRILDQYAAGNISELEAWAEFHKLQRKRKRELLYYGGLLFLLTIAFCFCVYMGVQ